MLSAISSESFVCGTVTLQIHADRAAGHGGVVWDAARCLAEYIIEWGLPRGCRVIELGAGTGLPGLAAAACGCHVVLTDKPAYVPLLQRNIDANSTHIAEKGGTAAACAFLFGGSLRRLAPAAAFSSTRGGKPAFDVVLACDVLSAGDGHYAELAKTFADCAAAHPACRMLLAGRIRDVRMEAAFFQQHLPAVGLTAQPLRVYHPVDSADGITRMCDCDSGNGSDDADVDAGSSSSTSFTFTFLSHESVTSDVTIWLIACETDKQSEAHSGGGGSGGGGGSSADSGAAMDAV